MKSIIVLAIFSIITSIQAQNYLSNLHATKDDPIYTTYAASLQRSEYIVNEAYQFVWYDPEKGISFEVAQAGNLSLAFKLNNKIKTKLQHFYKEPIITTSYSDLVKFYYYPYKDIRVENFFIVFNSRIAIQEIKITNESSFDVELNVYPYLFYPTRNYTNIKQTIEKDGVIFNHNEFPDGWMKEHNIPFQENLTNVLLINSTIDGFGTYNQLEKQKDTSRIFFFNDVKSKELSNIASLDTAKVIALQKNLAIPGGQSITIRVIRGVVEAEKNVESLFNQCRNLMKEDLNKFLFENEQLYSKIPRIKFKNKEREALYWNAFNLIRQCMLPPEGKCNYNYYVFSREPRWGWGYGGQVFHESLVMLAYVFMDPISAMNSQRVFIERQWEDGYINYRTGPYLDEQIPTDGQFTTSAPWFAWQNWEVYKVSKDKKFLEEAYESSKKFYNYVLKNRDSDNDGLYEWGANAILECVRDGRVAVWDEVGDPKNFEAVDMNIFLVSEAKSLSNMAKELGYEDESIKFLNDAVNRTNLINKTFWDDETGFYYHVDKSNHTFTFKNKNDLKRKEIIAFLALWAGVADKDKAEKLMKHLKNPDEFWRSFGIPTLSADDSYYNPIGYWNGPIWVPWQYLIFRGLLDYGYEDEAKQLVDKVLDNITYQLKTNHWFWEFYSADDYQAGWNKTYIWTGILARFLIDLGKE
ncbi:MAG: hypothetical protein KJ666_05310 [Bacteroidetes bacterium]|nr:hypothetical protein [Bacteroidota bacterium]MBU2584656.1 hypothetical protein [Bacteroidota bacterium]